MEFSLTSYLKLKSFFEVANQCIIQGDLVATAFFNFWKASCKVLHQRHLQTLSSH